MDSPEPKNVYSKLFGPAKVPAFWSKVFGIRYEFVILYGDIFKIKFRENLSIFWETVNTMMKSTPDWDTQKLDISDLAETFRTLSRLVCMRFRILFNFQNGVVFGERLLKVTRVLQFFNFFHKHGSTKCVLTFKLVDQFLWTQDNFWSPWVDAFNQCV